ncbi:DNA alkylation repair protein [Actinomadura hibisca]|uniref:DNA alkylation repair protein n=1 Tax=Actinomadura hibisca TaxID=68565 RepID=UPI0009FF3A6C|nr:DNA alkylation repair protein [Actinomadura hibisca]
MDVEEETARIVAEMRRRAVPGRAEGEKRYLKSDFVHLGTTVPEVRKVARTAAVRSRDDALALAETLWTLTESGLAVHEARMAAIEILVRWVRLLEPKDVGFVERLVRDSASWVYVDGLAEKVVGQLASGEVLDVWVGDSCMWVRRTALLALLPGVRSGRPDLGRISRYGDLVIGEREFFIRKALGWVLRELSKKDPAWVHKWVTERIGTISGVTIREAVRRLPEADAQGLLDAYRRR